MRLFHFYIGRQAATPEEALFAAAEMWCMIDFNMQVRYFGLAYFRSQFCKAFTKGIYRLAE